MDSKVVVTADEAGNVIIKSKNNPTWGHIRVEQTRMVIDENGFARRRNLSALIPGEIEDLKGFGWSAGDEVEGKVVIKESLNAFNKKDPERDLKIAGKSEVICCVDGQPIYRKNFFTTNPGAFDVTLDHDNSDEIKAAHAALKEGSAIEPNQEFDL